MKGAILIIDTKTNEIVGKKFIDDIYQPPKDIDIKIEKATANGGVFVCYEVTEYLN